MESRSCPHICVELFPALPPLLPLLSRVCHAGDGSMGRAGRHRPPAHFQETRLEKGVWTAQGLSPSGCKGKTAAVPPCPACLEKLLPLCLSPSLGECQRVGQLCLLMMPMITKAGQGWRNHCAQLWGISPHLFLDIPGLGHYTDREAWPGA